MDLSLQTVALAQRLLSADWTTLDLHTSTHQNTLPPGEPLSNSERKALEDLFQSREYALRAGITLRGEKFPVHMWEKTGGVRLVYGRRGNAVVGCGACVCRAIFEDGTELYGAVTYRYPSLSANAASKLLGFVKGLGKVIGDDPEIVGATGDPKQVAAHA